MKRPCSGFIAGIMLLFQLPVVAEKQESAGEPETPLKDWARADFERFIREADAVEYRSRLRTAAGPQPGRLLLKDKNQIRKFLGDFRLVAKKMCWCAHTDMLIFRKKGKELLVTIGDHCFDIALKPGVKYFKMPKDLYQRFKALRQADHERNQRKADAE